MIDTKLVFKVGNTVFIQVISWANNLKSIVYAPLPGVLMAVKCLGKWITV